MSRIYQICEKKTFDSALVGSGKWIERSGKGLEFFFEDALGTMLRV